MAGAIGYGFQNKDTHKNVDLQSGLALAFGGMLTARWGANIASKVPARLLKIGLGSYMICISPLVYMKGSLNKDKREKFTASTSEGVINNGVLSIAYSGLIGIFSGFIAGLLGVGGGSIVVPALCFTTDMSYHSVLGTSLFAMTLPAMVGTYTHYRNFNVLTKMAPALASGSLLGAYLGGKYSTSYLHEDQLRLGFSSLTLFLGLKTVMKL